MDKKHIIYELAASNWISTMIHVVEIYKLQLIKTCAYNNRFALKCAFVESYTAFVLFNTRSKTIIT